jgi:hypothetical protein
MEGRYWIWLVGRLLMAVIIVGWAASYLTPGGSGEKEFQKSLDAMKQVRSVRVFRVSDPLATQHSEDSYELACDQDAYHYKWRLVNSDPERPSDTTNETLQVGSASYHRTAGGPWEKYGYAGATPKAICSSLGQGNSTLFPEIATMIRRGILQSGDKKTVNGVRCREWKVTMKGGYSGLEHDTVCLGLKDHLPYEVTVDWEHSRAVYSDYNSPIQLELPTAELQPASVTTGSN